MTNEEQAKKIRYLRFSEKFEREEAIKALKKIREPSVYTGRIYHSYYMDLLAVALKFGGAIPLKGSQYGYDSPAAEVASMIDAQDTEIPQIGFALMAMSQMNLITIQQDDGQQMAITFSLVWQYTRQITAGAADKEERSGKPSGLDIPGAPVRDFPALPDGQYAIPGTATVQEPEKKKGKVKLSKKDQEAEELFERLWRQYPRKKGKDKVSRETKRRLLEAGEEKCQRFLDIHRAQMQCRDEQFVPYGSSFFNSILWEMIENNEQAPQQQPQQYGEQAQPAPMPTPLMTAPACDELSEHGVMAHMERLGLIAGNGTYRVERWRTIRENSTMSQDMIAAIDKTIGI